MPTVVSNGSSVAIRAPACLPWTSGGLGSSIFSSGSRGGRNRAGRWNASRLMPLPPVSSRGHSCQGGLAFLQDACGAQRAYRANTATGGREVHWLRNLVAADLAALDRAPPTPAAPQESHAPK